MYRHWKFLFISYLQRVQGTSDGSYNFVHPVDSGNKGLETALTRDGCCDRQLFATPTKSIFSYFQIEMSGFFGSTFHVFCRHPHCILFLITDIKIYISSLPTPYLTTPLHTYLMLAAGWVSIVNFQHRFLYVMTTYL
jgi:hypothetical protein